MAFGWAGSSWSPWSSWLGSTSDSDSDSDTDGNSSSNSDPATTSTTIVQTSTSTIPIPVIQSTTSKIIVATLPPALVPASSPKPSTTQRSLSSLKASSTTPIQAIQTSSSQRPSSSPTASSAPSQPSAPSSITAQSAQTTASSPTSSAIVVEAIPDEWEYWGCIPNVNGIPVLNTTYATSDELTPSLCLTACSACQYHFAGLQNGNACFCGSSITSSSISKSSTDFTCLKACTGDPGSICGGSTSMSFYRLKPYNPDSTYNDESTSTSSGFGTGGGSMTVIARLPEFTGTLMEYGDPRFKNPKDSIMFGETMKISSSESRESMMSGSTLGIAILSICFVNILR
ncbi:uncharacterized protein IL334_004373 [Kwoniella shivajii]|uniref:WSC domain-containing protein n=1 Tax=Kwoniella shivajii TaxID=564305 RepID=A0ABZ1D050_9TREE|nr:hypothetical protein IL334_004373 [Kwoniella shivajii]